MLLKRGVVFFVSFNCNKRCRYCSTRPIGKLFPKYEMGIEDVNEFISALMRDDVYLRWVGFTGGEPLIWKHLLHAAKMLKESGRVQKIDVFTNGRLLYKYKTEDLSYIDNIRVSVTPDNTKYIYNWHKRRLGSKLTMVTKNRFAVYPNRIIGGSPLPVRCCSDCALYFNHKMYPCTQCLPIQIEHSNDERFVVPEWATKKISKPQAFDIVDDVNRIKMMACMMCRGNQSLVFKKSKWKEQE